MGFFGQTEPRKFHHEYIYADERKRRMREIEERAIKELGITGKPLERHLGDRVDIRPGKHLRRRRTGGLHIYKGANILLILLVMAVVFITWRLFVYY